MLFRQNQENFSVLFDCVKRLVSFFCAQNLDRTILKASDQIPLVMMISKLQICYAGCVFNYDVTCLNGVFSLTSSVTSSMTTPDVDVLLGAVFSVVPPPPLGSRLRAHKLADRSSEGSRERVSIWITWK